MKLHSFLSSRRVVAWAACSLAFAWLAAACGNNGGSGDGVYDNSIPPGGATSAGAKNGGKSGSSSANGGTGGATGGAVSSSGASGSAGASGSSGADGSAGSLAMAGGSGAPTGGASGGVGQGGGTAGGSAAGGGSLLCGNGVVDTGETCDSGMPGSSNGGTSGGGGASSAGNGGDPALAGAPSVTPKYGQLCSNTCYKVSTQACLDCEFAGVDCFEFADNCLGKDTPFDAAQQTACYSVMRCIEQSNCFDGANTLGKCYCGSLSTQACGAAPFTGAGSPDGACVNEIKAGFPTLKSNSAVLAGLITATDFPSGAAMKRLSCQKGANSSACLEACGFTSGGPAFP